METANEISAKIGGVQIRLTFAELQGCPLRTLTGTKGDSRVPLMFSAPCLLRSGRYFTGEERDLGIISDALEVALLQVLELLSESLQHPKPVFSIKF